MKIDPKLVDGWLATSPDGLSEMAEYIAQRAADHALEKALKCYSPTDTAVDLAYKIRAMKETK